MKRFIHFMVIENIAIALFRLKLLAVWLWALLLMKPHNDWSTFREMRTGRETWRDRVQKNWWEVVDVIKWTPKAFRGNYRAYKTLPGTMHKVVSPDYEDWSDDEDLVF